VTEARASNLQPGACRRRMRTWTACPASSARCGTLRWRRYPRGSAGVPPKFSHRPSGRVRQRVPPGSFRRGWQRSCSEGRPAHPGIPAPGGPCFRCSRTSEPKVCEGCRLFPKLHGEVEVCSSNEGSPDADRAAVLRPEVVSAVATKLVSFPGRYGSLVCRFINTLSTSLPPSGREPCLAP